MPKIDSAARDTRTCTVVGRTRCPTTANGANSAASWAPIALQVAPLANRDAADSLALMEQSIQVKSHQPFRPFCVHRARRTNQTVLYGRACGKSQPRAQIVGTTSCEIAGRTIAASTSNGGPSLSLQRLRDNVGTFAHRSFHGARITGGFNKRAGAATAAVAVHTFYK